MVDLKNPSGAALIRTIATGAADDADWATLGTMPDEGITFYHPGGLLHLSFVLIDVLGAVVARGAAAFTFELLRIVDSNIDFVNNGTAQEGISPQVEYLEQYAIPGRYVVRVTSKSGMSGAANLLIYAQAGGVN